MAAECTTAAADKIFGQAARCARWIPSSGCTDSKQGYLCSCKPVRGVAIVGPATVCLPGRIWRSISSRPHANQHDTSASCSCYSNVSVRRRVKKKEGSAQGACASSRCMACSTIGLARATHLPDAPCADHFFFALPGTLSGCSRQVHRQAMIPHLGQA